MKEGALLHSHSFLIAQHLSGNLKAQIQLAEAIVLLSLLQSLYCFVLTFVSY